MTPDQAGAAAGSAPALFSGLFTIPVFLCANALFVAAEFALVAIRRTRVRELVAQKASGARAVERAVGSLDRYLATTQFGITVSSLGLGWLGEPALARVLFPVVAFLGPRLSTVASHACAFGIALLGITFLHIVLAELVPRGLALRSPDRVALWLAPPLHVFERIFRPLIWILNHAGSMVVRALGAGDASGHAGSVHSVAELTMLVADSEQAGVLERQEREMMQGVLAIGDLTVRQVMTPREDIVSVRQGDGLDRILQVALESGYSRLPVTGTGPEDVVGVLHTKDLLHLQVEGERDLVVLQDVMRQPQFVRTGTRVLDLLRDFQRGEQHVAFVLDDFGELAGLVTIEDLLEEIVGEIRDEFDLTDRLMKLDREGNYLASGRAEARACLHLLGVASPAWAEGTLGEFLRALAGRPLVAGERVPHVGLVFAVLEIDAAGLPLRVRIEKTGRAG
jgi:CBS domain containing-hemolysin-like protein